MSTNLDLSDKYNRYDSAKRSASRLRGIREHSEFEGEVDIYFSRSRVAKRSEISAAHSRRVLVLLSSVFACVVLFNYL